VSGPFAQRRVDPPADLDGMTALVLEVFGEVLGLDHIAEDDHFFDACGGTSVQAWWVITELELLLDVDLEIREFLQAPTARDAAGLLLGLLQAQRQATAAGN